MAHLGRGRPNRPFYDKAARPAAHTGSASGAIDLVGSSYGVRIPKGAVTGTITLVGSVNGGFPKKGNATGAITWIGSVTGKKEPVKAKLGGAIKPSASVLQVYLAPVRRITRRIEFYETDGVTPWRGVPLGDKRLVSGSVSIDYDRDERRTFDCELDNSDGKLNYGSINNSFWYDKVIKVFRGVRLNKNETWEIQLGEFMIDSISDENFPSTLSLNCRDRTKLCLNEKFEVSVEFSHTFYSAETLIKTLAVRAGISPSKIAITSGTTAFVDSYIFDAEASMWESMKKVAHDANLEIFFDNFGVLQIRKFNDPSTTSPAFTFRTGDGGSLSTYKRSTSDQSIFNIVVVRGESSNSATPSVFAVAKNINPLSPTSIARIGKRTTTYKSANVTTTLQAQAIADSMLAIMGLEEFSLDWESICFDWLSVGEIVEVFTDRDMPGSPTRYLLSSLNIPLELAPMSGTGKRLTIAS